MKLFISNIHLNGQKMKYYVEGNSYRTIKISAYIMLKKHPGKTNAHSKSNERTFKIKRTHIQSQAGARFKASGRTL